MKRHPFFIFFTFIFGCLISVQSFAEIYSMGSAINKSGRQRMLTQNIMKNYFALALDVDTVRSRKELDKSVALFEEQFQELVDYAPNSKIRASLSQVEDLWFEYRALAISPYSTDNGAKMLAKNNLILRSCHQVVLDLQEYAGRNSAKIINTSGRQRMLSQRIAAYYLAHALGFRDRAIEVEFEKAKSEYGQGLQSLSTFPKNSNEIKSALKKVNAQWKFSNLGFDQIRKGHYVPHVISVTTTGMLQRMDKITHLYEDLDNSLENSAIAATFDNN
ncbi:MAG: type IV pili methyl-accepting chemotaxis transducer N-terminal domain-containing protein [Pseudomonadales bacterium]|nr:type IV pili methyl-accepting chemotaxis transducer N-terminal domain-containing protein [Pseudomonadales bacterium]